MARLTANPLLNQTVTNSTPKFSVNFTKPTGFCSTAGAKLAVDSRMRRLCCRLRREEGDSVWSFSCSTR